MTLHPYFSLPCGIEPAFSVALGSGRGPAWGAKKVGEKVPCRDSHTFFALRHTTNQTSKKASLSGRLFLTLHPYFSLLPNTQQA